MECLVEEHLETNWEYGKDDELKESMLCGFEKWKRQLSQWKCEEMNLGNTGTKQRLILSIPSDFYADDGNMYNFLLS